MTFTTIQRAKAIYSTTIEVFDWHKSSECVTPYELALKQFEGCDVAGTVCIPGAGVGTYVLAAIEAGFKSANIYAVEFNEGYYQLGAAIFDRFGINYVHADFLTWEPQMEFDVIVGNPPFQKGGNSAFYAMFFNKAGEILKEGGYFSLVSPSKAAAKFSKGYKALAKLGLNRIEYGIDSWFPNIEQPMVVYSGSTKKFENEQIAVSDGSAERAVGRDVILPVQYVSSLKAFKQADAALTLSIFEKFFAKAEKLKDRFETLEKAPDCPYVYLAAVAWRYHPMRPKGGLYALLTTVNQHDQYLNGKFMRFETDYEAEKMHWLLSRSMLYRFVAAASCRAKFLPRVLIEEAPDYFGITSDEELCKAVGLTEAEINYLNMWNEVTA